MSNFVYVTNKNEDLLHQDRFNGVDYFFEPGKPEIVPVEAATHMFGWNKKDKTENLVRLGWANLPNEIGVKRLAKFVISEATFRPPEEEKEVKEVVKTESAEPVDPVPVHKPNFGIQRTGQAPRANPAP